MKIYLTKIYFTTMRRFSRKRKLIAADFPHDKILLANSQMHMVLSFQ